MSETLNREYWEMRYSNNETGWDVGTVSKPLKEYFDGLKEKNISILIPGAGNAWEAIYLYNSGFSDVTVLDLATHPLNNIRERCPSFPENKLIQTDFFEYAGKHDLIIEQTFFCALDPAFRRAYAEKMAELLNNNGILAGVLFDRSFEGGPPFGGCMEEYVSYFEPYFKFIVFEPCRNSIEPRQGTELFMILRKLEA